MPTLPRDMNPASVRKWGRLETVGDIRRGLRWLFLSVKCGRLETQEAYCLTHILQTMLKAVEADDLEKRLSALEASDQPRSQPYEIVDERVLQ